MAVIVQRKGEMYRLLLFLHILSAVIWLGGAMFSEAVLSMTRRRGDTEYARVYSLIADTGARLYPVATVTVIVTAIAMVIQRWSFGTMWIDIALGLFVVSFALGIGYFSPRGKTISRAVHAGGDAEELIVEVRKVHVIQRIDLAILLTILVVMVFKPG